jgi:hypothetical protein
VLRHDEGRVLGIFPRHRWPAVDSAHEAAVMASLTAVLLEDQEPDESVAALVALLAAIDQAHKVFGSRLDRAAQGRVRARARTIGEGDWGARATRDAVRAAQEATTAAVTAAVVASSVTST